MIALPKAYSQNDQQNPRSGGLYTGSIPSCINKRTYPLINSASIFLAVFPSCAGILALL